MVIMIVDSVNLSDGNIYLVSQGDNVNRLSSDNFDNVINSISSGSESLDDIFDEVSQEYGVDVNLLKAVAKAESDYDTDAVSCCGAQGIMQLMPATAQSLGVEDPFDARQNITGGAKMLAYLLDDYNGNVTLALAAYNAGSGSVSKYGGVPPYKETLGYIDRINDILGGVLSSDSTTVEGATATDLSGSIKAENTGVMIEADSRSNKESYVNVVYNNTSGSNIDAYITGKSNILLNYDEYKYVINTYKAIISKLFESSNKVNTSVDNETDNNVMNIYRAQAAGINPMVAKMLDI